SQQPVLAVVDPGKGVIAQPVLPGVPTGVDVSSSTGRVYVPTQAGGVEVFDGRASTPALIGTVRVGAVAYPVVNTRTNRIYVASSNQLITIDGGTDSVIGSALTLTVNGPGAANPTTDRIYLPEGSTDTAVVLDDPVPPDTVNPSATANGRTATVTFKGTDDITAPDAIAFRCSLDGGAPAACTSPASFPNLASGAHQFAITAIDGAGNVDPSPATTSVTIVAPVPPPAPGVPPPAAPAGLRAAQTAPDTILLSWDALPTLGYRIYRGTTATNLALLASTDPSRIRALIDKGLPPNASLFYAVSAVGPGGEGPKSPIVHAVLAPAGAPPATAVAGVPPAPVDAPPADPANPAAPTSPDGAVATPPAPAAPAAAPVPVIQAVTITGSGTGPSGAGLRVTGRNFDAARCPTVSLLFDRDRLGTASVDRSGSFERSGISVPGGARSGGHRVSAICASGAGAVAEARFAVAAASLHRSAFVTSLHSLRTVPTQAKQLGLSALLAIAMVALIAFPSELFDSTLDENYEEVIGWFGFVAPAVERVRAGGRAIGYAGFAVGGAALYSLLDPGLRLDAGSIAQFFGLLLSLLVITVGFGLPGLVYMRRRYNARAGLRVLPGAIPLAVLCVLVSRAFHFQPGYLYGVVAGIAYRQQLSPAEEGRLTALSALSMLGMSVAAWLVWLPVSNRAARPGAGFLLLVAETALAAIFVGGLQSLVISLLPLRFMEGARLVAWSRAAWAALFGLSLFVFIHVLLRPGSGFVSHASGSTLMVVALLVAFALGSISFWAYFRFRPARHETPQVYV
ncbi:MAG: hypothetical protein QOG64_1866, partial [Acidimicrobiaceae bacterium]|nr:hypothetical protein [Acidimicrobiaceae bacterium]